MTSRPKRLTIAHVIAALAKAEKAALLSSVAPTEIHSVVVDSRKAQPGSLFVALPGQHADGHDYIQDAIERGAAVVLAQSVSEDTPCSVVDASGIHHEFLRQEPVFNTPLCVRVPNTLAALQQVAARWRQQHPIRIVGVTGSVGKTTSKEVIAAVLRQHYCTLKSQGNYNNEIGLPLTLLRLTSDHDCAVLEMGMYDIGEISQLAQIAQPQIGVVTNVGPVHLERLGTMDRIAQAKTELPQALPPEADGGVAVLNGDDPWVAAMADKTHARVVTYGLSPDRDVWADGIESMGLDGIRFRFHHGSQKLHVRLPLLGRHSVQSALCSAAVGLAEGLSWEEIVTGLSDQSAQLRLVAVPGAQGSIILDDAYNSSPASCIAALGLLQELEGRRIAILGGMYELGDYEQDGHILVGRRARDTVDILVVIGRLGRIIGEQALNVGMDPGSVHMVQDNARAVDLARSLIQTNDIILVKGSRSLQMEEIVDALTAPKHTPISAKEDPS